MSLQNKAIAQRFYQEVLSGGNLAAIDQLIAPNVVDHSAEPGQGPGAEGLKQMVGMFRQAFPDLNVVLEELVAEGDVVVARVKVTGTHRGEFMGAAPTGKAFTVNGLDFIRIKDGKAVELWHYGDEMTVFQQLGIVPATAG